MRKLLIFFVTILGINSSQAQWAVTDSSWDIPFFATHFLNQDTGFIANPVGLLYRTQNGGFDWQLVNNLSGHGINAIHFKNLHGYAVGALSRISRTLDGGTTWTEIESTAPEDLFSVFFVQEDIGYAVGGNWFNNYILKTTDGFNTWNEQTSGNAASLKSVYFLSELTGYAAGDSGTIIKTTNGGQNWTSCSYNHPGITLYSLYFIDETTGYAAGDSGTIIKTTNGGQSWTKLTTNTIAQLNSITFTSSDNGYAVGRDGVILKTNNSGTTWTIQTPFPMFYYKDVCFVSPTIGYAVGGNSDKGCIIKTTNGGATFINEPGEKHNSWMIYPNPATNQVNLTTQINISGKALISIFSSKGQLMLKKEIYSQTESLTGLDQFPRGMYLIEINTNNTRFYQKLILM